MMTPTMPILLSAIIARRVIYYRRWNIKWFKHYCNSLSDPFIEELMDEFGATGYLAYFGLIELIGQDNGQILTGKLRVKPTYLRRKLRTSQAKLRQVYDFCQTKGKLLFNICGEYWEFEFTKIAEIKDNHTSNLQVTCKQPSLEKSKSKNKSKNKIKIEKPIEHKYGEYKHILLSDEKYDELKEFHGEDKVKSILKILDEGIESKGYQYVRFFAILKNGWPVKEWEKRRKGSGGRETVEEKAAKLS